MRITPTDLLHPTFEVKRDIELKAIDSLLVEGNGEFAPHEHIQEGLEKVYDKFDLSTFESYVQAFLNNIQHDVQDNRVKFVIFYSGKITSGESYA